MEIGRELLYLSRADVEVCGLSFADAEAVVEGVFRAKATGRLRLQAKTTIRPPGARSYFIAMPGALDAPKVAAVKWVGLAQPGSHGHDVPHVGSLMVISDAVTAMPMAVLDGTWITAMRTAAVTVVAARRLARPSSRRLGVVACGLQARFHAEALRHAFPLAEIRAYGQPPATAEAFAASLAAHGIDARAVDEPRQAIEGMDLVVTSVPEAADLVPFLRPEWLAPGSFASMVDLGRSWIGDGLKDFDLAVTDDHAQTRDVASHRSLTYSGPFHADLGELVAGQKKGRTGESERAFLLHPGMGLSDIAVANRVVERARERGLGTRLPL